MHIERRRFIQEDGDISGQQNFIQRINKAGTVFGAPEFFCILYPTYSIEVALLFELYCVLTGYRDFLA